MKQTSKFKIGIDYRMAAHTGIGTYLRGIVQGLAQNNNLHASELALFSSSQAPDYGYSKVLFDSPIYSISEQCKYGELLKLCSLWHSPHYNIPFSKKKSKLIVTIHDIIHWIYRKQLNPAQRIYMEVMLRRAINHSDHILTVSESSKRDLIQTFHVAPEKISVVYNGIDSDFKMLPPDQLEAARLQLGKKYQLPASFFLYVGMLKPHKNIIRLMTVYRKLRESNRIASGLVIIGQGAPHSPELKLLTDLKNLVIHLPRIEYGDLKLFYNCAHALIHPSLYEGFGLTVAEAMVCGTPVLTTRRASLPEVGGEAARYIDGEDDQELERALCDWDHDHELRLKMQTQGFEQVKKFSWANAAQQTYEIYKKILV